MLRAGTGGSAERRPGRFGTADPCWRAGARSRVVRASWYGAGPSGLERHGRAGMGFKVVVDFDKCESNALCMGVAPEVFEVRDDDFLYVLQEEPPDELKSKCEEAARLPEAGHHDRRSLATWISGRKWISTSRRRNRPFAPRCARGSKPARSGASPARIPSTSTPRTTRAKRPTPPTCARARRGSRRSTTPDGRASRGRRTSAAAAARAGSSGSSTRSSRASTSRPACSRWASRWPARRSSRGAPTSSSSAFSRRC